MTTWRRQKKVRRIINTRCKTNEDIIRNKNESHLTVRKKHLGSWDLRRQGMKRDKEEMH